MKKPFSSLRSFYILLTRYFYNRIASEKVFLCAVVLIIAWIVPVTVMAEDLPGSRKENLYQGSSAGRPEQNVQAIREEVNARLGTYREQKEKLQKDLEDFSIVTYSIPPLIVPPKPEYPPKPVKKDTASSLKRGSGESDSDFRQRVQTAREADETEYQSGLVAYRLLADEADARYEKMKSDLERRHTELQTAEEERIKRVQANLPRIEAEVAREIAILNGKIAEDLLLLEKLVETKQIVPLAFACSYTELPWFTLSASSFQGVEVTWPQNKMRLAGGDYELSCNYLTAKITFSSQQEARQFMEASKSGKLYCIAFSDKGYWQKLTGSANPTWKDIWSETYSVEETPLIKDVWEKMVRRSKPLPVVPHPKPAEPGEDESSLENIEEPVTDPEKTSATVQNPPLSSPRLVFGTSERIFTNLKISVDGSFTFGKPGTTAAASRPEHDEPESPASLIDNKLIAVPGTNAGDACQIAVDDIIYSFRWCPSGTFRMGKGKSSYEVTLTRGFWMLETEVTQEMYQNIMKINPSNFRGNRLPVEYVTWNNCRDFCLELTKKAKIDKVEFTLPTEAQWEYASRAGSADDYGFGNDTNRLFEYCNYCDSSNTDQVSWQDTAHSDGFDKTAVVGSLKPNAWGLYDMHGNVWEWCSSRYGVYPKSKEEDPTGPTTGASRIFRGGAWSVAAGHCTSSVRFSFNPTLRRDDIGFRICVVPQ